MVMCLAWIFFSWICWRLLGRPNLLDNVAMDGTTVTTTTTTPESHPVDHSSIVRAANMSLMPGWMEAMISTVTLYTHAASFVLFYLFVVLLVALDIIILLHGNTDSSTLTEAFFRSGSEWFPSETNYSWIGYVMLVLCIAVTFLITIYRALMFYNRRMTHHYRVLDHK